MQVHENEKGKDKEKGKRREQRGGLCLCAPSPLCPRCCLCLYLSSTNLIGFGYAHPVGRHRARCQTKPLAGSPKG